jgi:hypothetical protein
MEFKKLLMVISIVLLTLIGVYAVTSTTATVHFVVPSSYDFTIAWDSNVTAATVYFVETDSPIDGSETQIFPYADDTATDLGQTSDDNHFSITLTGTASADVNAYWSTALPAGVTYKIALAQATGGCGADNNSGYEEPCSVTDGNDPVTDATCKSITTTDTAGVVIYDSLDSGGVQGFCAWADFSSVAVGDTPRTFNILSGED